jgi:hypothetical protein
MEYLAEQLGVAEPSCVTRYTDHAMTALEHAWQIRGAYESRMFDDPAVTAAFR